MLRRMLACCKVYISESRNKSALEAIERGARKFPEAVIVNKFEDVIYNRVGYTLVSEMDPMAPASCPLRSSVLEMVSAAFETIDLDKHCGNHPRLGVVDHICFHPLTGVSMEHVSVAAKSLAADVGAKLQVPTFLYGGANAEGRTLYSLRKELSYFKPNADNDQWSGGLNSEILLKPEEGPSHAVRNKGVVVIGSTPWVSNYNVPIFSTDMDAVRRIAKRVSERGGGLASVQSMALAHGKGMIEVACNLLDTSHVGGEQVQREVERLGREYGMVVGEGYYTDLSPDKIVETFLSLAEC